MALDESELPTDLNLFQTLDGEILASPSLKTALETAGLSGLELRQAIDHRNGDPLHWFQLIPSSEMPPWDPSSVGYEREDPCPNCQRDGYFNAPNEPFEIAYTESDVAGVADITRTYERFGNSVLREDSVRATSPRPDFSLRPASLTF